MADECDRSEIVTAFLLNTCRLSPCPRLCDVEAAAELCAGIAGKHPPDDDEAEYIPLTTGSVAEFYIEPMLPLVGDVDVMFHRNTMLVIPRGHPPPTQLPAEFHNYVNLFEIVDSHLPGYVYLKVGYLLTQCTDADDGGKYNSIKYEEEGYMTQYHDQEQDVHGPAAFMDNSDTHAQLSVDQVPCVRCLSWPSQACLLYTSPSPRD